MTERKWFTPGTVEIDGKQVPARIICPHTKTEVPATGKFVDAGDEFYVRRVLDGDGTLSDRSPAEAEGADAPADH